jgi:hypothetical protein
VAVYLLRTMIGSAEARNATDKPRVNRIHCQKWELTMTNLANSPEPDSPNVCNQQVQKCSALVRSVPV